MATESVDDPEELRKQVLTKAFENLSDALADIEYKYPEGGEPGAAISAGKAYAKYFTEVDAYYTRECARKVLEGNVKYVTGWLNWARSGGGHITRTQLEESLAELRAAIEEVGDGDGKER